MSANSIANFINTVANGNKKPCPHCNTLNNPDANFCISCGKPIGTSNDSMNQSAEQVSSNQSADDMMACPNCGAKNPTGYNFCISCGKPLTAQDAVDQNTEQSAGDQNIEPIANERAEEIVDEKLNNPVETTSDQQVSGNAVAAFAPITSEENVTVPDDKPEGPAQPVNRTAAFQPVQQEEIEYEEPQSVFAEGLPSWDVVPPQVVVRRKKR